MQHSPTAGYWNSQLHSFCLCPSLNSMDVNPIDYKISRDIHFHEYMLRVNKTEEIKQWLVEVLDLPSPFDSASVSWLTSFYTNKHQHLLHYEIFNTSYPNAHPNMDWWWKWFVCVSDSHELEIFYSQQWWRHRADMKSCVPLLSGIWQLTNKW